MIKNYVFFFSEGWEPKALETNKSLCVISSHGRREKGKAKINVGNGLSIVVPRNVFVVDINPCLQ